MSIGLTLLSNNELGALLNSLDAGRLRCPFPAQQLARLCNATVLESVAEEFKQFSLLGFSEDQVKLVIKLLLEQRNTQEHVSNILDLVTTGPDVPGISNRDTSVVVRQLFSHATRSVMVVGFAVYQGKQVFAKLAEAMDNDPGLDVKLLLNIHRDSSIDNPDIAVARFLHNFKEKQWPTNRRLPKLYYDPRSLSEEAEGRSVLHAKCVVVDDERAFVSSANFTEAAQKRNIEVGVRIDSAVIAKQLSHHFNLLIEHDVLVKIL